MKPSQVPFQTLCSFFDVVCRKMKPVMKHRHLRRFREKFIERTSEDVFSIYRLLAPAVSTKAILFSYAAQSTHVSRHARLNIDTL